jgi:predicted N-acetyltransferase YhbS
MRLRDLRENPMPASIRAMTSADRPAVAELIYRSTNAWYQTHARPPIFVSAQAADVFFDTYESLDPGCGLVACDPAGKLVGSCFFHPRPTHMSLGIMNAAPDHAGKGVARALLTDILRRVADKKPVRLVSSAINLDSYSLYHRAGFVPRAVFQDMFLAVPAGGLPHRVPGLESIRPARPSDLPAMAQLDADLLGIRRDPDYAFFLANRQNIWTTVIAADTSDHLTGWLTSNTHSGSGMIGPGLAADEPTALALLAYQLNHHAGRTPVFLIPATATSLTQTLYAWGARNCELHFQQVLGPCPPIRGIPMPSFLPESA